MAEQWREGCYVIDFKVGQSFGEPQVAVKNADAMTNVRNWRRLRRECGHTRLWTFGQRPNISLARYMVVVPVTFSRQFLRTRFS
ncbi:MAG: hypothetical protein JWN63_1506 [Candidatus Acidoferrum typicum]|jgi:hypothetical protein|nr:hypothetical protein [Candidatus Acidoferrum typicum]